MRHRLQSAFLLCNGEVPSRKLARRLARSADYIVAADGGANAARQLGIRPQTIVGDLDSVRTTTISRFPDALVVRIRRQDNTDLEKALDFIAAQRVRRVTISGITGKRIDFTLANFSVLWRYTSRLDLTIAGDGWMAFPVRGRIVLKARKGTTVSIVPFGRCEGVTLSGLKYPLRNASLKIGDIGVSNVAVRSAFSVKLRRGHILVFILDHIPSRVTKP